MEETVETNVVIVPRSSRGRSSRKQTDAVAPAVPGRSKSAMKTRVEAPVVPVVVETIVAPESAEVKVRAKRVPKPEPMLIPNPKRFVLFPIAHQDLYDMYKKHLSTEWRPEEVDMSSDIKDWEKMDDGERHFITHVLAFFAASDGIVMENLSMRFATEVQYPEARQFYAVQNKMEAIHCVAPETPILTDTGYHQIVNLVGQYVNVWNGEEFSNVQVVQTSESSPVLRVTLSNGMELQCTHEHKWFVGGKRRFTKDLVVGDIIDSYTLPKLELTDPTELPTDVPINYSTATKLEWLKHQHVTIGFSANGAVLSLQCETAGFLQKALLMFTTMGINPKARLATNDLYLTPMDTKKVYELGFSLEEYFEYDFKHIHDVLHVVSIVDEGRVTPTYCFNEPLRHAGTFAGIVTGQSESYSLMIDTLIKEPKEKEHVFGAIETIPSISKKAKWAMKWMEDKDASFAQRLCCFAIVEGIFFSSSFASFFWLKEKGKLKGCTQFNEWISRDESLHTDFACMLYSHIVNRVPKSTISKIFKEAVAIEKEFITESIPCRLIGMNSDLMCQYIEFVADRLVVQLGYPKIFGTVNPFPFMERISVDLKGNFFEVRITNYANAVNVGGPGETKPKVSATEDF